MMRACAIPDMPCTGSAFHYPAAEKLAVRPMRSALLAFSLSFLAACSTSTPTSTAPNTGDAPKRITILHTNDHHGRFWHNDHDEYGLSAQKTVVDGVRAEVEAQGGSVLLFSGGDINTGVPASDMQDAEPDFKGMRMIGYDAMSLGNHEFDNTLDVLRKQIEWAGFPVLSANIYRKGTNEHAFQPYAIFERQGLKIAVIGLTTEDTWKFSDPTHTEGLEFRSTQQAARDVIAELKKDVHPDVIIAVTHMGHYPDGQHGVAAPGDVELARAMPEGALSMIVGGHSQNPVCMVSENVRDLNYVPGSPCAPDRQNGTWIVQAHEWGKYVGRADFIYKDGQFVLEHYQLIPVNLNHEVKDEQGKPVRKYYTHRIEEDPQMLNFLTPYQQHAHAMLERQVGTSDRPFEGARLEVRGRQAPLAQLVLAGYLETVPGDLALMNGGGMRDALENTTIRVGDLYRVLPFGSTVVHVTMNGTELARYLDAATAIPSGAGGFAQLRKVTVVQNAKGLARYRINGKPLSAKRQYTLVTNSFVARGGDGYPTIDTLPSYVDRGIIDIDTLIHYVEHHPALTVSNFTPENHY